MDQSAQVILGPKCDNPWRRQHGASYTYSRRTGCLRGSRLGSCTEAPERGRWGASLRTAELRWGDARHLKTCGRRCWSDESCLGLCSSFCSISRWLKTVRGTFYARLRRWTVRLLVYRFWFCQRVTDCFSGLGLAKWQYVPAHGRRGNALRANSFQQAVNPAIVENTWNNSSVKNHWALLKIITN